MKWLAALFGVALLGASHTAEAYVLGFERYLVCRDDDSRVVVIPRPSGPRDQRVPVKRRGAPARLDGESLVTIDVAVAEPLPTRKTDAPSRKPAERLVMLESRNDFRCIGWTRGKAGVLRVIGAPPGARFYDHQDAESYRRTNIVFAGTFAVREAIDPLRRVLTRPIPAALDAWQRNDLINVKRDAAIALADMGHRAAAREVLTFVELLEEAENLNYYDEALDALARLDRPLANQHALALLEEEEAQPSERFEFYVDALLPFVRGKSPRTLALMQRLGKRLGTSHLGCRVAAVRVEQGDTALVAEVKPHVENDIRNNFVANCYTQLVEALAPGRDPDELDILLKRQRWREMVQLLVTMQRAEAAKRPDPRFAPARAKMKAWLLAHQAEHLYDPQHENRERYHYMSERDALYTVALAHLGDARAVQSLVTLVGDGKNEGVAPWIAARHGLALGIDGVSEALTGLLERGIGHTPVRHSRDTWPQRGHRTITEGGAVIEALARRGDARYALGLLADHGYVREVAAFHLARRRSPEACGLVGKAARRASKDAVEFAFWALSRLGNTCNREMRALARDASQPHAVRGMAAEVLAMLRDPTAVQLTERAHHRDLRAAYQRAELIYRAPE